MLTKRNNKIKDWEKTIGDILALLVVIFVLGLVVFTIIAYLNEEFVSGGIGASSSEAVTYYYYYIIIKKNNEYL